MTNGIRSAAQYCQLMAFRNQRLAKMPADQTGAAGDQYMHSPSTSKPGRIAGYRKHCGARKLQKPL